MKKLSRNLKKVNNFVMKPPIQKFWIGGKPFYIQSRDINTLLNYKKGGKVNKLQLGNIINYTKQSFNKPKELYNKKLNASSVDINTMINYKNNYDKLFLDPKLLKGVDDYMISKNIGLPQRQAILYSIWQEGSRTGPHGNGAYGLVGWRGQRAKNLSDTVQGQSEKLYNELFGEFNADNWNNGGKGSGYKSGRVAQQSFINAKTFNDALKALNYGYIRPPRKSIVKRLNSKIF